MTKLAELAGARELLVNLTLRDLRGRFRRTTLGWAWTMVTPLATMAIFTVVFRVFLRIKVGPGQPSGLHSFALFLLTGLLAWNFFALSTSGSAGVLLGNAGLVQRVYFPREVLVLAGVGSALVSFAIEIAVLSVVLLAVGNFVLPFLPVVVLLMLLEAVFVTGLALAMSVLNVYFRDLEYIISILLQLLFYSAPIIYSVSYVPLTATVGFVHLPLRFLYDLNPMVQFVQAFRYCLYDLRLPPIHSFVDLAISSAVMLGIGTAIFIRLEPRLAEEL